MSSKRRDELRKYYRLKDEVPVGLPSPWGTMMCICNTGSDLPEYGDNRQFLRLRIALAHPRTVQSQDSGAAAELDPKPAAIQGE